MSVLWFEYPQVQLMLYVAAVLVVLIAILLIAKIIMIYKNEKKKR